MCGPPAFLSLAPTWPNAAGRAARRYPGIWRCGPGALPVTPHSLSRKKVIEARLGQQKGFQSACLARAGLPKKRVARKGSAARFLARAPGARARNLLIIQNTHQPGPRRGWPRCRHAQKGGSSAWLPRGKVCRSGLAGDGVRVVVGKLSPLLSLSHLSSSRSLSHAASRLDGRVGRAQLPSNAPARTPKGSHPHRPSIAVLSTATHGTHKPSVPSHF
jgi:hypothetical protein